jgi:predicted transcriptional regulator
VTQEIELQRAKRLKQIVNWLEEGYSYTEIGTKLGITRQAVSDFAKKHNLPKPQFLTASDAARLWGCSVSTVYKVEDTSIVVRSTLSRLVMKATSEVTGEGSR